MVCHSMHLSIRKLVRVSSLLSTCVSCSSGWAAVYLLTEPFHWPINYSHFFLLLLFCQSDPNQAHLEKPDINQENASTGLAGKQSYGMNV